MERQQALIEKMEKDRELERKVEVLELENRTLSDKLDTRVQTGALPVRLDYTFKVEQMEYAKQGYVVKEEEVDALDREQFNIPDRKFFETILEDSLLKEASIRKILYIHKFYYKVSLGIDFSKIMYALEDGKVLFYGARSCTPWRTGRSSSTVSVSRNCTTSPARWSRNTATSTGWRS